VILALTGPCAGAGELAGAALEEAYRHEPATVRANFVVSLDGAVETDGRSGSLGGADDREVLATLRAVADVVLVAAGTVRSEGYGPAWLTPERRARRLERGQPELPAIAVVTQSLALDPGARLFTERRDDQPDPPRPIVLTGAASPAAPRAALEAVADVVVCGDGEVDLIGSIAALAGAGLSRVLCEGGPRLLTALVADGVVDELCLTHAPILAGPGRATLTGPGGSGDSWRAPSRFELVQLLEGDGVLMARYRAARPAS
jgi:riboflavin biosynthesis pyrimidine reductase